MPSYTTPLKPVGTEPSAASRIAPVGRVNLAPATPPETPAATQPTPAATNPAGTQGRVPVAPTTPAAPLAMSNPAMRGSRVSSPDEPGGSVASTTAGYTAARRAGIPGIGVGANMPPAYRGEAQQQAGRFQPLADPAQDPNRSMRDAARNIGYENRERQLLQGMAPRTDGYTRDRMLKDAMNFSVPSELMSRVAGARGTLRSQRDMAGNLMAEQIRAASGMQDRFLEEDKAYNTTYSALTGRQDEGRQNDATRQNALDLQSSKNVGDYNTQGLKNQGEFDTQGLRNDGALAVTDLQGRDAYSRQQLMERGATERTGLSTEAERRRSIADVGRDGTGGGLMHRDQNMKEQTFTEARVNAARADELKRLTRWLGGDEGKAADLLAMTDTRQVDPSGLPANAAGVGYADGQDAQQGAGGYGAQQGAGGYGAPAQTMAERTAVLAHMANKADSKVYKLWGNDPIANVANRVASLFGSPDERTHQSIEGATPYKLTDRQRYAYENTPGINAPVGTDYFTGKDGGMYARTPAPNAHLKGVIDMLPPAMREKLGYTRPLSGP